MKIVLMGAPGCGKGSQATYLTARYSIVHISTGDIFRENISKGTPIGQIAASYINKGNLVPDDVTCDIVKDRLTWADVQNGFLLDGFPRNVYQAEKLAEFTDIDYCVNMIADYQTIFNRICGRRICKCGAVYHVSKLGGREECLRCGGKLYQRADDNPETIKTRYENYLKLAQPLVEFYRKKGNLIEVDANKEAKDVFLELTGKLGV